LANAMPPWHSQTHGHPGIRPVTRELSRMLKKSASIRKRLFGLSGLFGYLVERN
jgi:hypothetical protein